MDIKITASSWMNYSNSKVSNHISGNRFSDYMSAFMTEKTQNETAKPMMTDYFERTSVPPAQAQGLTEDVVSMLTDEQKRILNEKYDKSYDKTDLQSWTREEQNALMNDLKEWGVITEEDYNKIVNADLKRIPLNRDALGQYFKENGTFEGFDFVAYRKQNPPKLIYHEGSHEYYERYGTLEGFKPPKGTYDYYEYYDGVIENIQELFHFLALKSEKIAVDDWYKVDSDAWKEQAAALEKVSQVLEQIFV